MTEEGLHLKICPACQSPAVRDWFIKSNSDGKYKLCYCKQCGTAFVNPRPAIKQIEAFYNANSYRAKATQTAQERLEKIMEEERAYPNSTLDAVRLVENCKRLSKGTRFLDAGAGYGFFSRQALENGFDVYALEPASTCREVFNLMNGFEPDRSMLNQEFALRHRSDFDVVLMSQVLEHVLDLDECLVALRILLKDGGIAAIAVPHFRSLVSLIQGKRDMFINPPEHLNYFTTRGLENLFHRHGFRTIHIETISRFNPERLGKKIPARLLRKTALFLLSTVLNTADMLDKGMYLTLYFQKEQSDVLPVKAGNK